ADPAEDIEGNEPDVVHLSDAGHKRRKCPDNRDKTGVHDRLSAVFFVESVRTIQMLPAEQPRIWPAENFGACPPSERISKRIAGDRRHHQDHVHSEQIQVASAGYRADQKHQRIAWKKESYEEPRFGKDDTEQQGIAHPTGEQ